MIFRSTALAALLLASAADAGVWGSFDATRINYANGVFTTSPNYTDLRANVVNAGGSIGPATGTLSAAYLDSIDVFYTSFLDIPNGALSPAEQTRLVEWVKCGGTLIVTAEYSAVPENDSFLKPFGIVTANSGGNGAATVVQNHPLVSNLTSVNYFAEAALTSTTAQTLMNSAVGNPFLMLQLTPSLVGGGRVLAVGDHTPMTDSPGPGETQLRKNVAIWAEAAPPVCPNATAAWTNYGAGWPGTNGVPQMTLTNAPALGDDVKLQLENSAGKTTTALVIFGAAPLNAQSALGGSLLVVPKIEALITLPAAGATLGATIPCDVTICGATIYMQTLEVDDGASHGVSFTRGLSLTFGS